MILTYKYRIKDANSQRRLRAQAFAINQVWNFCASTARKANDRWRAGQSCKKPNRFSLESLCAGAGPLLGIRSDTITRVCAVFAQALYQGKKCPRYRSSYGPQRALGWIPFRGRALKLSPGCATFNKQKYRFWESRALRGTIKSGAFVEDARGRWYLTIQSEIDELLVSGDGKVGIDLGLKSVATLSDGTTIPALQHYRRYESGLAKAQRAGNKHRARAIHAKIANARRHHLHEQSSRIASENSLIVIGNLNAARLARSAMAKSILDASCGILRSQLRYKASRHGATLIEVDEAFTTQTCSCCGVIPDSSPKGRSSLGIRFWDCSECGTSHDRDVNAARNILKIGLECQPPAEGMQDLCKALTVGPGRSFRQGPRTDAG